MCIDFIILYNVLVRLLMRVFNNVIDRFICSSEWKFKKKCYGGGGREGVIRYI